MFEQPPVADATDATAVAAAFATRFSPLQPGEATALIEQMFGWVGVNPVRLETERDDTFRLESPLGTVVAKFAHPADPRSAIADQVAVLQRLEAEYPELPLQRVVPALDGEGLHDVVDASGARRLLRVLAYLPGERLGSAPRDAAALHELGSVHGALSRAIAQIGAHDSRLRGSTTPWNLVNIDAYAPHTTAIADPVLRAAAEAVIDRARDVVLPRLDALPALLAHNDMHGDNILIAPAPAPFAVCAVLDFGDMTRTPRVADLAVAASYARGYGPADDDPWAAVRHYVAGFERVLPLSAIERTLLPELVLLRLAQRAALNSLIASSSPQSRDYAGRNIAVIARDLRDLRATDAAHPALEEPPA